MQTIYKDYTIRSCHLHYIPKVEWLTDHLDIGIMVCLSSLDDRPPIGKAELVPPITVSCSTIATSLLLSEGIVVVVKNRSEITVRENTPRS